MDKNNTRAILFMMAAMAGYIVNDAFVKLASETLPTGEIIFVRGVIATALLYAFARYQGKVGIRSAAGLTPVLLRSFGETTATILYLTALFHMPIANVTAILQVAPLAATAGAAIFLKEQVGWRRWSAIFVGLLGVLLIVKPGLAGFSAWSLVALVALAFMTLRDLATRVIPDSTPTLSVSIVSSVCVTALGAALGLFENWQMLTFREFLLLFAAAVWILMGYICIIQAMRIGEMSVVSPFRYTIVLWAIALGYFIWGDVPDWLTISGTAVVILTGVYTFYRESRASKAS